MSRPRRRRRGRAPRTSRTATTSKRCCAPPSASRHAATPPLLEAGARAFPAGVTRGSRPALGDTSSSKRTYESIAAGCIPASSRRRRRVQPAQLGRAQPRCAEMVGHHRRRAAPPLRAVARLDCLLGPRQRGVRPRRPALGAPHAARHPRGAGGGDAGGAARGTAALLVAPRPVAPQRGGRHPPGDVRWAAVLTARGGTAQSGECSAHSPR